MENMIEPNRRGFLGGLVAGLIAAPAIVKAGNIMPVRTPVIWRLPKPQVLPQLDRTWIVTGMECSTGPGGVKAKMTAQAVWHAQGEPTVVPFARRLSRDAHVTIREEQFIKPTFGIDGAMYVAYERQVVQADIVLPFAEAMKYQPGDYLDLRVDDLIAG